MIREKSKWRIPKDESTKEKYMAEQLANMKERSEIVKIIIRE